MTEPPDFDRLFRSVDRSAVHLEMRDDYAGSSPAFAAWREQRPYDRSGPDAAWHALVGGVIVGISEQLAGYYLPAGFQEVTANVVLLGTLVLRPQGLFSDALRKRV